MDNPMPPPIPANSQPIPPQSCHDDEIDLVELVAVLWRQRWFMVLVGSMIVGLAVAFALVVPSQYEITAQVSPGIVGFDDKGLPIYEWKAKDIETWFANESYLQKYIEKYGVEANVPEVTASTGRDARIATVSLFWPDSREGEAILRDVISLLTDGGAESMAKRLSVSRHQLEQQIEQARKEREHLAIARERLKDEEQNEKQALAVEASKAEQAIHNVDKEIETIEVEKQRFDYQITQLKNEQKVISARIAEIKQNSKQVNDLLGEVQTQIDNVNKDTQELIRLRKEMVGNDSDKVALLMYANITQQNISYVNTLRQQASQLEQQMNEFPVQEAAEQEKIDALSLKINEVELQRDKELPKKKERLQKELAKLKAQEGKIISDAKIKIQDMKVNREQELLIKDHNLQQTIDALVAQKEAVAPVEVVQQPFGSVDPVKPAKRKIVAIAFVLGGFMALMLAFVREFWLRNKSRIKQLSA